jgi:hypothetical protein
MRSSRHIGTSLAIIGLGIGIAATARASAGASPGELSRDPAVLDIIATDFGFEAPASIRAGVTTNRVVHEGREYHHPTLIRLEGDRTSADLAAEMKGDRLPAWASFVGGPNGAPPGGSSEATLALKPGNYVVICVIPSADGTPHFMKGMVRDVKVTGPAVRGELPAADVAFMLSDYEIKASKPLTRGRHTIRIRNYAAQPHEVMIFRLLPGKTEADLMKFLSAMSGDVPAVPIGGVAPMSQGTANNLAVDLEPGSYIMMCFVPDVKDGKSHLEHGMINRFTIE